MISARTAGVPLTAVDVTIPDFMANNPVLDVTGNASGSLQSMLAYVNATPIVEWIDGLTDEARTLGNARVALKMQIPLVDGQPAVQGAVKFAGNEVQLWKALPALQQLHLQPLQLPLLLPQMDPPPRFVVSADMVEMMRLLGTGFSPDAISNSIKARSLGVKLIS